MFVGKYIHMYAECMHACIDPCTYMCFVCVCVCVCVCLRIIEQSKVFVVNSTRCINQVVEGFWLYVCNITKVKMWHLMYNCVMGIISWNYNGLSNCIWIRMESESAQLIRRIDMNWIKVIHTPFFDFWIQRSWTDAVVIHR